MDSVSQKKRSEIMALVRSKNTRPELAVRKLVFSLGYRYRLHRKDLPGCPDLVFKKRGKVIFVHGCFWHRHKNCPLARLPKSRLGFWKSKLEGNERRDRKNKLALMRKGWKVLTVWECQVKDSKRLGEKIGRFLDA